MIICKRNLPVPSYQKKKRKIAESMKVCYITQLFCYLSLFHHIVIALNINSYRAADLQWTTICLMKELGDISSVLRNLRKGRDENMM
jgi:hypothetical protein